MKNLKVDIKEHKEFGGKVITIESVDKEKPKSCGHKIFIKLITGAIIGFVNGFWGGGGGMICVPLLIQVIGLPEKIAHATTLLIMLPLSIASLVVYIINGNIVWLDAVKIGIGFIIGGIIGAVGLKYISNAWLGIIFSVIIIAGGIKLLI